MRCLHLALVDLAVFINRVWLTTVPTPRRRVAPAVMLQSVLGFVFLHCGPPRRRLRSFRAYVRGVPVVNKASLEHWLNQPGIYLFVELDGPTFYIGRSVHCVDRYFEHLNTAWRHIWRSPIDHDHEDVFHARLAARGPGAFLHLRLAVYPDVPRGSPVRPILDSTLAHAERCLIFRLSSRDRNTLNVMHTWRMTDLSRLQRYRFALALAGHSASPATAAVTSRCWRQPITADRRNWTARRFPSWTTAGHMRVYIVNVHGQQAMANDLLSILSCCSELTPAAITLPLTIRVLPRGTDLTRYTEICRTYGESLMTVRFRDGSVAERVRMANCRTLRLLPHRPEPDRIELLTVVRRPRLLPDTRRFIASLTWSWPAQQFMAGNGTLHDLHRLWVLCSAIGDRVKRATRRACISRLCQRKFGVPARLNFTIRVPGTMLHTRADIRRLAARAISRHSPHTHAVTRAICARLRVVFTKQKKVQDVFDNVRRHMQAHTFGSLRPCTCQHPVLRPYWRHTTGCVCFMSTDWRGDCDDVLQQSCKTTLEPARDDTDEALCSSLLGIARKLFVAAGKRVPPRAVLRQAVAALAADAAHPDPPAAVNLRRARRLRRLLCDELGLVCSVTDHGPGTLWFMCPRLFDRHVATTFPLQDSTRFTIVRDAPAPDLVRDITEPFARRFAPLVPVPSSR